MKKVVLAATTALVAAGSAAALEVTLGGEVSSGVSYNGAAASPVTPWTMTAPSAKLSVSAAGESMGWTYGGSFDIDAAGGGLSGAEMSLSNASVGSLSLQGGGCGNFVDEGGAVIAMTGACVEWSGMSVGGFAVSAAINPADLESSIVGLAGSIGGMSAGIEVANSDRSFDAALGTAVAGASVAISMTGDLDNTAAVTYGVELGMAAMGSDLTVTLTDAGAISVKAAMGDLALTTSLTDGDAFNSLKLVYDADIADGLNVAATLEGGTTATTFGVTTTLSF